jgi:hypothetical protein
VFPAYRAYLHSCVSAIEAFFTLELRKVRHHADAGGANWPDLTFMGIEDKIELWSTTFCGTRLEKGRAWNDFKTLKRHRNRFVHPSEPTHTFTIRNAIADLNLCQRGVGGLIWEACSATRRWPTPDVIKVAHAPTASFASKSNGAKRT